MKARNIIAFVLLFALMLTVCACGKKVEEPQLAGGWTEKNDPVSAEEAEIFSKAVAGTEYEGYTPTAILGTQVVAGTNYKFACADSSGNENVLTVYRDLQGNCSVISAEK